MNRHLTLASLTAIGSVLQIFAAAPVVVVPDEATAVERFATSELAEELGKCLGEIPEIVREGRTPSHPCLFVGATKVAKALRGKKPWQTDGILWGQTPWQQSKWGARLVLSI